MESSGRSGVRHSVLWDKLAAQAFQIDIFRGRFYEPSFLHLLISRKSTKFFHGDVCSCVTSSHLLPKYVLKHVLTFARITYVTFLLPLLSEQLSKSYLKCSSWTIGLIWPKLNLTHNSHIVHFLSVNIIVYYSHIIIII